MWNRLILLSLFVCGSLGEDRLKKRLGCLNVGSSAGVVGDNTLIDLGNGFVPPDSPEYEHWINCALPKTTENPNGNGNGDGNNTDCGAEADIVFLLDTSGSVGMSNFNTLLQFVQNLVQRFTIGPNDVQIGVDVFSTFVTSEFNLNTYDNEIDVVSAIGNINYRGGQTNIAGSIDFMVNDSFSAASGNRPGIPKIGIVITDGGSDDKRQTLIEAQKARDNGIAMIAVGVGNSVDAAELDGIANKPSSQYVFRAQNFNVLNTLQASLSAKACTDQVNSTTIRNGTGTESGTGSSAGGTQTPPPAAPPIEKRAVAPGSSAGAYKNCLFCPPNVQTTSQTGTGTGNTVNNTVIKNGTAEGTGSSAGGTKAPQGIVSSTLAPEPAPKRSKKSATSASQGDNSCEFFCPENGSGTNSQQTTNSPTTTQAPATTASFNDKTTKGAVKTIKTTKPTPKVTNIYQGSTKAAQPNQGQTKSTPVATKATTQSQKTKGTTIGQQVTTSAVGGNVGSSGSITTVTSLPNIITTDGLNSTDECRDLLDCRPYGKEKVCPSNSTYHAWAKVRCKVYCSFCDPHTSPLPCVDQIPNCNEYGDDLCTNPLYRLFKEDNCEKFCGLCKDSRVAVGIPPVGR